MMRQNVKKCVCLVAVILYVILTHCKNADNEVFLRLR